MGNPPVSDGNASLRATVAEYLNDCDLRHAKHQFVTYSIIVLVVVSVVILVLETKRSVAARFGGLLLGLDTAISIVFTVEYLLRIWSATDGFNNRKGWRGAWAYMKSPYGVIDMLAVGPFYLGLIFPAIHLGYLRIFRLLRILLLARYIKSFAIIKRGIVDKKAELIISLQVVAVLTVILSVLMFEIENAAQPDKFADIPSALAWSLSKFVSGIGGYGDFYPTTPAGQVIATLIGLLVIALFAVPAGIIASGFVHEIEQEKQSKEIETKAGILLAAFRPMKHERLGVEVPRKYVTMVQAKSRLHLEESDIIRIAEKHAGVRLRYKRVARQDAYPNALLIESYPHGEGVATSYGARASFREPTGEETRIVVINPGSYEQTSIGHFGECLARALRTRYLSNELFGASDCIDPTVACDFAKNRAYGTREGEEMSQARTELLEFIGHLKQDLHRSDLAVILRSARELDPVHLRDAEMAAAALHADPRMWPAPHVGYLGMLDNLAHVFAADARRHGLAALATGLETDDLHSYIAESLRVGVVTIVLDEDILEWRGLEEYYTSVEYLAAKLCELAQRHRRDLLRMPGLDLSAATPLPASNGTPALSN